jgi:hypothetical protein
VGSPPSLEIGPPMSHNRIGLSLFLDPLLSGPRLSLYISHMLAGLGMSLSIDPLLSLVLKVGVKIWFLLFSGARMWLGEPECSEARVFV